MARPSNTAQRREQIVAALLRVMARTGFERATVQAIADEAGLAPGLVHYHFESKQAVLLALVEHLSGLVRTRWERRVRAESTPRERLLAFVDAHVGLGDDADPAAVACWVALGAEAAHQPDVRELWERVARERTLALTALVQAALEADGRPCAPAPAYAATLLAAIEGAFLLGVAAPGAVPVGFAGPGLHALVRGLLGEPSPGPVAARTGSSGPEAPVAGVPPARTDSGTDWAVWDD